MIRWANPELLYLLIAIPILTLFLFLSRRRLAYLNRLILGLNPSLRRLRWTLLLIAFGLLILAGARPKWGERMEIVKGRGVDLIIGLDVSKSMRATDVKPDRLTKAKTEILKILDELSGNRIGLITFAGDAWVLCPLTTDLEAVKLFLDLAEPGLVPLGGTELSKVLIKSLELFGEPKGRDQGLIIFTDGENLGADPLPILDEYRRRKIKVFTVGIGTPEGSTIPEYDRSGNFTGYKKDREGKLVYSRLGERLLLVIAKLTGGRYVRIESGFGPILDAIRRMKKGEMKAEEFVKYEERYQLFLLPGIILFLLSLLLPDQLPKLLLLLILPIPLFGDVGGWMRKGNRLYKEGKFEEAIRAYEQAQVLEPDNERIRFNKGCALYRAKRYDEAEAEFQLGLLGDRRMKELANFNIANVRFRKGDLKGAIETYIQTLILNPDNLKAKRNLEFCLKLLERLKQNPPQPDTTRKQEAKREQRPGPEIKLGSKQAMRLLKMLEEKERESQKERLRPKRQEVERDW